MTNENLHLAPEESFPEHLDQVSDQELQVLDSQVQRQIDHEIVTGGESDPETEFRRYELDEEFENRDEGWRFRCFGGCLRASRTIAS